MLIIYKILIRAIVELFMGEDPEDSLPPSGRQLRFSEVQKNNKIQICTYFI